ncbi:MAG: hypothetical protein RLZZ262_1642 [Bacteroidota bacterium]|jgi:hypothetical protein
MNTFFTLCFFTIVLASNAQIIYSEDFTSGMPEEIMLYNLDGLTPDDPELASLADSAWTVKYISSQGFSSGNAAFSVSWYVGDEGPSDDWMVLPAVTLGSDPYLSWVGMAITSSGIYRDQYQVFVSTGGNEIEDYIFLSPIFDTGSEGEMDEPTQHQLSLSAFAGETVYIAFRNWTQPYNPDLPTGPGNGGNELAIDNIIVSQGPVSVEENSFLSISAIVSPNPFHEQLTITLPHLQNEFLTFTVTDMLGKVVFTSSENISGGPTTLLLSELPSGIYILTVTNEKESFTSKIIKN